MSKVILSQSAAVKYLFYRELYPLPRDTPVNWLGINQLEKKPIDLFTLGSTGQRSSIFWKEKDSKCKKDGGILKH